MNVLSRFTAFLCVLLVVMASAGCDAESKVSDAGASDGSAVDTGTPDSGSDASVDASADLYSDLKPSGSGTVEEMLGVSSHMYQGAGDNAERTFEFEIYKNLGGLKVREDYLWGQIEPVDGEWHFEAVETQVALAVEAGVEVTALLVYGVGWAMPDGKTSSIPPEAYADFAAGVAGRFCNDVKTYEVWNEPDLGKFWSPKPDPVHYAKLLAAANRAIKKVCPDARVLFAGMSSFSDLARRWWFLDEAFTADPDICGSFDILALHPYTLAQASSPERDWIIDKDLVMDGQTRMTTLAKEKLAAMGCPGKPIWFTEMGWPSYDIGEEKQGRYLARSVLLAARDGVDAYFWYTFWDGEPITTGSRPHENYFGLFGWPGAADPRRAKPSFLALNGLVERVGGLRYAKDLSPALGLPNDVYVLAFIGDAGGLTLAMWDGRDDPDRDPEGYAPGGEDTSYSFKLPMPSWNSWSKLMDIYGNELASNGKAEALELVLTPRVQYLVVGGNPK